MKLRIKGKALLRESLNLALLGALAGYIFVAFYYVSNWVSMGSLFGWNPIVNNFWGGLRNLTAALFFYPAIGLAVNFTIGALTTFVTQLLGLDEERRWTVGVIVVGVVGFAVLGIPFAPSWIFTRNIFAVGYAVKLALGACFIFVALRWERIVKLVTRVVGLVLAGSTVLWVLFVFVFQSLFSPDEPKGGVPSGPNIVVILSDSHRADVDSIYGGDVPTPNIEKLAEKGVTFDRCFSTSNWTIPNVTSLFTGLAPEVTGMDSFYTPLPPVPYLPEQLSRIGYRTWAMMGNPILSPKSGFDRGFDHYAVFGEYFYGQGFLASARSSLYGMGAFEINRILKDAFYEHTVALGPNDSLKMLRSLNPAGGDFLYIHLSNPHTPYHPPERYLPKASYDGPYTRNSLGYPKNVDDPTTGDMKQLKRLYEGEVRLVDEYLGEAMDILDNRDLWENTVVVYLADHGEEFKEHGDFYHARINLHHELTHVPLVIYWPGRLEDGSRVRSPVSLGDVYLTLLDGLGLEYETGMYNGNSLFEPLSEERPVFAQRCLDGRGRVFESDFVVRGEAALFLNHADGSEELYLDYYNNRRDVARYYPDLVAELKLLIDERHTRNAELIELYGTDISDGAVDPAQLENLRALGYLQ